MIGTTIKLLAKAKGITLSALAAETDIDLRRMYAVSAGYAAITVPELLRIAAYFDVTAEELCDVHIRDGAERIIDARCDRFNADYQRIRYRRRCNPSGRAANPLYQFRQEHHLTQEMLGRLLGTTAATISRYELGVIGIPNRILEAIS